MKNFNVKQSGSEVKLEEVNPYLPMLKHSGKAFTPLILTSIDPNIKVDQVIREDQLEPDLWQYKFNDVWINCSLEKADHIKKHGFVRQVAKLKQPVSNEDERDTEQLLSSFTVMKIHGYKCNLCGCEGHFDDFPKKAFHTEFGKEYDTFCKNEQCEGRNEDLQELFEKQPVHETPKSGHDLETCTEKQEKVTGETPIQEEETGEREEIVWDEVIHFYNSGDPLEDNHCSMIRQLMNKYELKRK